MHVLHVEVPKMILRWGSLGKFSAQTMERMHQWS
jgi:hypothetical protein